MEGLAENGKIRVGDVSLALAQPANFINGASVQLACRPEAIRLAVADIANTVQGTITFVRDLGPVRDFHLDTPLGKLVVEQGADQGRNHKLGDKVHLTLPPEALRIYPRSPAAEPMGMAAE